MFVWFCLILFVCLSVCLFVCLFVFSSPGLCTKVLCYLYDTWLTYPGRVCMGWKPIFRIHWDDFYVLKASCAGCGSSGFGVYRTAVVELLWGLCSNMGNIDHWPPFQVDSTSKLTWNKTYFWGPCFCTILPLPDRKLSGTCAGYWL